MKFKQQLKGIRTDLKSIKPDAQIALQEQDPLEVICQSMADRGFASLWAPQTSTHANLKFNDETKREYLRVLAVTGRKAFSAASVGISTCVVFKAQRDDKIFAYAMGDALEYFQDILKAEMYRRGITGFKRQVIGGKERNQIIEITDYSDKAMELLTRVHMPEMQKKHVEVTGSVDNNQNVNVNTTGFDPSTMPPEDLKMFKKLLENQVKRDEDAKAAAEGNLIEGVATHVE